jgi:ferrous iron transport protein A
MTAIDQNNAATQMRLGSAKRGYRGVIQQINAEGLNSSLPAPELESRLIELGFVEGARVEVLHEGIIGRDPIAVRIDSITVAVRRREAMAVIVG